MAPRINRFGARIEPAWLFPSWLARVGRISNGHGTKPVAGARDGEISAKFCGNFEMPVVYYGQLWTVARNPSATKPARGEIRRGRETGGESRQNKKIMAVRTREAPPGAFSFFGLLRAVIAALEFFRAAQAQDAHVLVRTVRAIAKNSPCSHGARDAKKSPIDCGFALLRAVIAALEFRRAAQAPPQEVRTVIFYHGIYCYNSAPMKRPLPIFLLLLLSAPILAAEDGIVVRTTPLYAEPSYGADRLGQVEAGTAVNVETRRGGWKKVVSESASVDGWVRSYQVRDASAAPTVKISDSDSRGFLSGLASLSRKASSFFRSDSKRSSSSSTATIGVRGLSEAEIMGAQADFEELEKLHRFASSRQRSTDFARKGGLGAIAVTYIDGSDRARDR